MSRDEGGQDPPPRRSRGARRSSADEANEEKEAPQILNLRDLDDSLDLSDLDDEPVEERPRPPAAARGRGQPAAPRTLPPPGRGFTGTTNGARRAADGLTNGLATDSGARTGGLRSGKAEPVGHVNGIAAGLVNGISTARRGLTNGLTNDSGFTNGLGAARFAHSSSRGKWKLFLIPLVCAALLLLPLFSPSEPTGPARPIVIDGRFSDWPASSLVSVAANSTIGSNIDIVRFGVVDSLGFVAVYVEVAGTALQGGGPAPGTLDTVRIFLDTDGSPASGYSVQGFGADRLLEVWGVGGVLQGGQVLEFDTLRDRRDWNGWTRPSWIPAASAGSRIEMEVDALALGSGPVTALAYAQSWNGQTDVAEAPLSPDRGTLVLSQESLAAEVLSGTDVPLLRITATGVREDVTLDSIGVRILGTATPGSASALRLLDSSGTTVASRIPTVRDVTFDLATPLTIAPGATAEFTIEGDFPSGSGATYGVRIASPAAVGTTNGTVGVRTIPSAFPLGYVGALPPVPQIDGGFSEWTAASSDSSGESAIRGNAAIDITEYGSIRRPGSLFLYADVAGRILSGTPMPASPRIVSPPGTGADRDRDTVPDSADLFPLDFNNDGVPDAQTFGDVDSDGLMDYGVPGGTDQWINTTIPTSFPPPHGGKVVRVYIGPTTRPVVLGDDVLRFFLDTDNRTWTGYAIAGIGADRLIEVRGKEGDVTQSAVMSFAGSFPGEWSWAPISPVTVAASLRDVELVVPFNATALYLEAGDFWGGVDATTSGPALAPASAGTVAVGPATSFVAAPAADPLAVPWEQVGPEPTSVVDPSSDAVTTLYNHQRKVVRAGDVSGDTACDATNSDGCWYVVLSDKARPIQSDFKDGTSVAMPTTLGALDSLATALPAGDNLILAAIQLDNTAGASTTIAAGDLELRRGTSTVLAENEYAIVLPATGGIGDGMFTVLSYKDSGAASSPTYGVYGAASATGVNAEVKILVLNGFASADSAWMDGGSVSVGASTTSVASVSTSFPASSSSLPNIIIAPVQIDMCVQDLQVSPGALVIRRGTTSGSPVIASNEYLFGMDDPPSADGISAVLVAIDTAGAANQGYSVWGAVSTGGPACMESKLLAFRGVAANAVDSGSVSIGTSRTVIGTAATSFATGDDVAIGAMQLSALTSTRTIAAGGDDIRRTGEGSGSSNEFAHVVAAAAFGGGQFQTFVRKVTTTASSPSYEGAATAPAASSLNAELKLIAIHLGAFDRVIVQRSADTGGSTWGSQVILASGNTGDSPLLSTYDSAEPSIALDASGFLHVVWVSAASTGDQSTFDRVRYTKTTVAYPTQGELAAAGNWESVTNVDDASVGFMPTVSTDTNNAPHIAWSGSKTGGTVYYKNKVSGTWNPTVSWGTTFTGLSVDVSPQTNYVSLARYFESYTAEVAYRSATVSGANFPKTRTWDGSAWSAEAEQATAGSPIRAVRMARSPVSLDTRIFVTLSDDGWLDAYVCTPTCSVTNNVGQVWSAAPTDDSKRFDVAFEQTSGDAILAYSVLSTDATRDLAYRTYSGSWGAEAYLDDTSTSGDLQYAAVVLASEGSSNRIGLIGEDNGNNDATAWIWDGSSWGNFVEISADVASGAEREPIGIAWETNSGHLIAATRESGSNNVASKEFTTSWSGLTSIQCGPAGGEFLTLKPNPVGNDMVVVNYDNGNILGTCYWTGTAWSNGMTHDSATDTGNNRLGDFAWEATGSKGLLVWGTTLGQITYRTFTAPNTWGTITNPAMGTNPHRWVQLRTNPSPGPGDTKILGAVLEESAFDLGAIKWDGTTFTVIGPSTFSANVGTHAYESFDMEYGKVTAVEYTVCKDVAVSACDASGEFTKADGTAGFDTVASAVEAGSYPSLATTHETNGDLWVAYAKNVDASTRAIYARFLDYNPGATWAAAETVDSLGGTLFTRPSIGIDKDNTVHALYVATAGPELYYNARTGGTWDPRTLVDTASDNPTLMVRAPSNPTYGADAAGLYWKTTTSETYFFTSIPEFELIVLPAFVTVLIGLLVARRVRNGARPRRARRLTTRTGSPEDGTFLN